MQLAIYNFLCQLIFNRDIGTQCNILSFYNRYHKIPFF
nr:MAG TPA: hypothetical protein [Caudoviricetes sp.]